MTASTLPRPFRSGRWHTAAMSDTTSAGSGEYRLDAAVPAVAHPSLKPARGRLVLDKGAVADALHPAPGSSPGGSRRSSIA